MANDSDAIIKLGTEIDTSGAEKGAESLGKKTRKVVSDNVAEGVVDGFTKGFEQIGKKQPKPNISFSEYAQKYEAYNREIFNRLGYILNRPKLPGQTVASTWGSGPMGLRELVERIQDQWNELEGLVPDRKGVDKLSSERQQLRERYRKSLVGFVNRIAPYDLMPRDITRTEEATKTNSQETSKLLPESVVERSLWSRFRSPLRRYYGIPGFDFVTRYSLEDAEVLNEITNTDAAVARSNERDKIRFAHNKKAIDTVADYLLMDKENNSLKRINEIYGLGRTPSVSERPVNIHERTKRKMLEWGMAGVDAEEWRQMAMNANISPEERNFYKNQYGQLMRSFLSGFKANFPEEGEIYKGLVGRYGASVMNINKVTDNYREEAKEKARLEKELLAEELAAERKKSDNELSMFYRSSIRGLYSDAFDSSLSVTERKARASLANTYFNKYVSFLEKNALPAQMEHTKALRMWNKTQQDTLKALLGGGDGGGSRTDLLSTIGGAAYLTKQVADLASVYLESYWDERITRSVFGSRRAENKRIGATTTAAGGVLGAVLGGVIAGSLSGGTLTGVGAAIGGTLLGTAGKEYGVYREKKLEADIKSADSMMMRARLRSLYGDQYQAYFASAITDTGIANGESAMTGLADRAMSLRARTMLGQVGEEEMLYYSMMPNYYSALMSGITGPQLASIYRNDLQAIGDPSMRYLVGQKIANQDAYAFANSKYFGSMYGAFASESSMAERGLRGLEQGYVTARIGVSKRDIGKDYAEIVRSTTHGDRDIYSTGSRLGPDYNWNWFGERLAEGSPYAIGSMKGQTINVIVNVDGEEIKKETFNTAEEDFMEGLQSYYVGG